MFSHLSEDWPWIVVPALVVALAAAAAIALWGGSDAPVFTYGI